MQYLHAYNGKPISLHHEITFTTSARLWLRLIVEDITQFQKYLVVLFFQNSLQERANNFHNKEHSPPIKRDKYDMVNPFTLYL